MRYHCDIYICKSQIPLDHSSRNLKIRNIPSYRLLDAHKERVLKNSNRTTEANETTAGVEVAVEKMDWYGLDTSKKVGSRMKQIPSQWLIKSQI